MVAKGYSRGTRVLAAAVVWKFYARRDSALIGDLDSLPRRFHSIHSVAPSGVPLRLVIPFLSRLSILFSPSMTTPAASAGGDGDAAREEAEEVISRLDT
jgi:hypothetical protein